MNGLVRFYRSFTGRMVLATVLLHALLVPILVVGMHRIVADGMRDEFVNNARSQSRQLALLLEGKSSKTAVEATLQDWLLSGQLVFADLLPNDGETIRGRSPDENRTLAFTEDYSFGEHNDSVYYILVPLSSEAKELNGTLRVGFDEQPTKERIDLLYQRGLLLVGGYLAVALLLAWGAGSLLRRAIRQISDAARRIATSNPEETLDVQTEIAEVSNLTHDLEFLRHELYQRGRELQTLAYYDALTGLANRILFRQHLTAALDGARRSGGQLAILYLDLDHFKRVNDVLGHEAGDQLLHEFAKRLQDCLRHGDLISIANAKPQMESVARMGGDEFTVLLPDLSEPKDAERVAQRILAALHEPLQAGQEQIFTTTSIGIAVYPFDGRDQAALLKSADTAMYYAKQQGKNRFHFYTSSMNSLGSPRLDIESALHEAIEQQRLVLYYQPQVEIKTGKLVGAEALLRWDHASHGMVPPGVFIPMAEESGLIVTIGEWVLREACAQLRRWRGEGFPPLRMSVNVSARQFRQASFPKVVAGALREFGIEADQIVLEITETALIASESEMMGQLESLRTLGVGLSLDDFGTGFSSLAFLKRFPVQNLKIDRSFVQDIPDQPHSCAIVRAVISLGQSLDVKVVAEGVETVPQRDFLAQNGCPEMQGYLISPPIPAETFSSLFGSPMLHHSL